MSIVKVYVVVANGLRGEGPIVFGAYATRASADSARRFANIEHNRTKRTMGAFRIIAMELA